MNRDVLNLIVFFGSLLIGAGLCLGGHVAIGTPIVTFALGHAVRSPWRSADALNPTPSLERVEREEEENEREEP